MADFTSGRAMASQYAGWAFVSLFLAGPALALLSAFDAATDGTLNLRYPIFNTHCWMTLMGWCVPMLFGLVFWLFPLLKETPLGRTHIPTFCLILLIPPTIGMGAYLFLSHSGFTSLFLLPAIWGLYLVAGILYALLVWRLTVRTLRPTATDLGIQAGAIWLLVVLAVRLLGSLGAMATGRDDFLASSDAAIRIAMLFGFIGNTGLALAAAVTPPFLASPHPRARVLTSFRVYNTVLAIWCGGAAWVLPYPFSLGRLLLALAGFAFVYGVVRLLLDLRMLELLLAPADSARRMLTRAAMATGALAMLLAAAIVGLVGVWAAGTVQAPPADLMSLPMHLMAVGLFSNLILALYVPVTGARSMVHVKSLLAWGAFVLMVVWMIAKLAVAVLSIIGDTPLWAERYMVGWTVAGGLLLLGAWLISAFAGAGRPAPARPPQ